MLYVARGSEQDVIAPEEVREILFDVFKRLGERRRVLALPPDFTRLHSQAGLLTVLAHEYYGERLTDVLPALGTHSPMTAQQIATMFPGIPAERFRVHDWRRGVVTLGEVPADYVREVSGGAVDYAWPAQVDRLLAERRHDLVLSLGQVVPHEVIGMANHAKNIFVGTGGPEGINKSHFLGAAYGMERIMGRADTPVRRVLDYAAEQFMPDWPLLYVLTVIGRDGDGKLVIRGLFVGEGRECFERAAALSLKVNFEMVERPLQRVVVYLDPAEYKSTWLGNKAIYRTRMAIADGGELIVLAPGVREFGEDAEIDRLVRRYGYVGTPRVLKAVRNHHDLAANLSAAAHLIHGSSEGRFTITYCPGHLDGDAVRGVNFRHADLETMLRRYNPDRLRDGLNTLPDGETIFYISNPALGLWAARERFRDSGG